MTFQDAAPISHIISPKGLGGRSYDMIQRCFMQLSASSTYKNAVVNAFKGGRGDFAILSDESGLSTRAWFEFDDFKYRVLYSDGEEIRDDQVLKIERFRFYKFEKASFDPNNIEDSPNIFFELETKYDQHGDEKTYVDGSIIIGEGKDKEPISNSEEAFQMIPVLFGEIFPEPFGA